MPGVPTRDDVYSVAMSNYEVPAVADDWLDKTLLEPAGKVTAVELEGQLEAAQGRRRMAGR